MLAGCGHRHKRVVRVPAPPSAPGAGAGVPVAVGYTETGVASWYGYPYHGRAAADGEIYDMEKLTAAHRTLPFDTWVRVVNLENQQSVEVRINDRGPFVDGRIIDLSRAAARTINMIGPGTARVKIEVIRAPEGVAAAAFGVQVGAFRNRNSAEQLRARLAERFGQARLVQRADQPGLWRVVVGAEPSQEAASQLSAKIREEFSETNAFVVRLDSD